MAAGYPGDQESHRRFIVRASGNTAARESPVRVSFSGVALTGIGVAETGMPGLADHHTGVRAEPDAA